MSEDFSALPSSRLQRLYLLQRHPCRVLLLFLRRLSMAMSSCMQAQRSVGFQRALA